MISNNPIPGKDRDMTLADLLAPSTIVSEISADGRLDALVELVGVLSSEEGWSEDTRASILESLRQREDDRSTGIGNGVAIPHCFSEDIDKVSAVFGRSTNGVDFCALDRAPVHFIVLFIVPQSQYALHLKTLAAIAKTLNSAETREKLNKAKTPEQLLEVLSEKASRG